MARKTSISACLAALAVFLSAPAIGWAQTAPALAPAAPAAPQAAAQFFYNDAGKPSGPFTLADIQQKIAAGAIKPETLVWKAGTPDWVAAKDMAETSAALDAELGIFLLGTWQNDTDGASAVKSAIFNILGGGVTIGTIEMSTGESIPFKGSWNAHVTGEKRFDWTVSIKADRPGQAEPSGMTETAHLEIVDNDTLRDLEDNALTKRIKPKQ